jgi:thiol:disulfide interchange protein DsbG
MRRLFTAPVLSVAVLALIAVPTYAAEQQAAKAQPAAPAIASVVDPNTIPAFRNSIKPGTEVRYMGDEFGLKVYFLFNGDSGQVAYVSPDGQAYLVGALFASDGTPVSVLQLARLQKAGFDPTPYIKELSEAAAAPAALNPQTPAAQPAATSAPVAAAGNVSPGQRLMAEAASASWIAFGSPQAPMVTAFMDPNCPDCHLFFNKMLPLAQQNKVYLRVIPVTVIDPANSQTDLLNIFSSPSPAESWKARIAGQKLPPVAAPNPQALMAITNNNNLFIRWNLPGTPYIFYQEKGTGPVKIIYGEPSDMKAFAADLGVAP